MLARGPLSQAMNLAALLAVMLFRVDGQVPDPASRMTASAQEHVRELIASLPAHSQLRDVMQHGETGDGSSPVDGRDAQRRRKTRRVHVRIFLDSEGEAA
jgi:hypothetical protein